MRDKRCSDVCARASYKYVEPICEITPEARLSSRDARLQASCEGVPAESAAYLSALAPKIPHTIPAMPPAVSPEFGHRPAPAGWTATTSASDGSIALK